VRDWNALVREHLPKVGIASSQREEIVAEIAGHLEEFYEGQCVQGMSDVEAFNYALAQVTDWPKLARKIERARRTEGKMNQSTRTFWLPAFITVTAWVLFEAILAQTSYGPRMISGHPNMMLVVGPIWLAGQPLLGAIGAYASRRAGGTRSARLAAGLFPAIVTFAGICAAYILVLIAILHGRIDQGHFVPVSVAKLALGGVVIPGLAMLLGTLPFLRPEKARVLAEN
jgi:hypothetical protein